MCAVFMAGCRVQVELWFQEYQLVPEELQYTKENLTLS